ncbi:MAG: NAD(P)/FAD-dependent oxidoreductase [Gammaproteobacteria bacterium]|nr:NAD(P)/FAD-dependent oxidoreductase [Gammaproteobacteria bacterium]
MQSKYVVVGGGLIGLAIARELTHAGQEVLVLEKNIILGAETSFRNSAVVHAGIYYLPQTLKAKLCVEGRKLLIDYCDEKKIAYNKRGKLIVATSDHQLPALNHLLSTAKANQIKELIPVTAAYISKLEPEILAVAGLYSPETAVLDGHSLLKHFTQDVKDGGGTILCGIAFQNATFDKNHINIQTNHAGMTIVTSYLINAAGLWASAVAREIVGMPIQAIPFSYYAKGHYFELTKSAPFSHLIYPLPETSGLGIHATTDLKGITRFGPDVEWVNEIDYTVSPHLLPKFYHAIKQYYPAIKVEDLQPAFAGVRPKTLPPDQQPQDFIIQDATVHGLKNVINLFGMESPGLTSCLAIAKEVRSRIKKNFPCH